MPEPIETPAPADDTAETPPPAEPEGGEDMGIESDMPEEPSDEMPEVGPEDVGEEGDVTFKSIQKLTGKLAQKIRDLQSQEEEITSKDAKYVVNSILSALSDNLEDDDKDDIISKLEGEEEEEDMGMEDTMDMEDTEMESPEIPQEEPSDEMPQEQTEEVSGEELEELFMSEVMGKIFSESKVDDIISKYFVINENEKKFQSEKKKQKELFLEQKIKTDKNQIVRLSESIKQEKVAVDIINSFPEMKLIGKTNKGNLVFEHNNKQLKVSPKGELL
jgi:DNA mismatch repair ATPase MutL